MKWLLFFVLSIGFMLSCRQKEKVPVETKPETEIQARFTEMPPEETGVTFSNFPANFKEDYYHNLFLYEHMYNGGGVAAGDVNGDNLPDLYFTSTFGSNKLYINLGNLKFKDVTDISGVDGKVGFKTGTMMADINGDGKLDIYVCRTSKTDNGEKTGFTFINMGNKTENGVSIPIFEDQTKKLGLEDNSNSVHACCFDYDRDGDLDFFLLNSKIEFAIAAQLRLKQGDDGSIARITTPNTPFESNKFYRNDNGHFKDVTKEAGLESSAFGLSVTTIDLDRDGWMDLYIANDFIEPDRILINNHNGTFTDKYSTYLKHSSQNSMGSDIADINNDGLDDIIVLDMKAEDPIRYKTLTTVMTYDRYNLLQQYGYGRQVGRNVLQLNNGNNTFSEIGQYAGIAATDWSWGALMGDFDNDGWKDIYIANGYRRDLTNLDYLNFIRDSIDRTGGLTPRRFPDINTVINLIPEHKVANYLFINNKQLAFTNATKQAGMDKLSFSNGSAYADLDADGDLDLIVNNIQEPPFIYRNDITGNHWLQIDLQYKKGNMDGIGASADLYAGGLHQHEMMITNKSFYSSSEPILQFGLGKTAVVDSIILQWPDGSKEIMKSVVPDKRLIWKTGSGEAYKGYPQPKPNYLFHYVSTINGWKHQEDIFVDFKREKLLPYMLSAEGPCMSTGDVNGDKLEDVYVGNGSGYASVLFLQNKDNNFTPSVNPIFTKEAYYEACGSILEDMDGDGDIDLVIASGGSSVEKNNKNYDARYYVNDGKGTFSAAPDFPKINTNAGAILAVDYDGDKDLDILIAGRSIPGEYPNAPRSYLLKNDHGKFQDVTNGIFPDLQNLGMITDVKSGDLDGDQIPEIVFVGDWIPVTVFTYKDGKFKNATATFGLENTSGWWRSLNLTDIDNDGDLDLFAGNIGLNNRLSTSEQHPITLVTKDFDGNGSLDPILCYYYNEKLYPFASKDVMISQIPVLKKRYIRYTTYASATLNDIFSKEQLQGSTTLKVNTFQTTYFVNENKKFVAHPLPYQVQLSPVYAIIAEDFDKDGKKDILMAGNFLYSETETAEFDAGNGVLLLQNSDGTFRYVPNIEHGFWAQDEVRELKTITLADGHKAILTANNKGPIQMHLINNSISHAH